MERKEKADALSQYPSTTFSGSPDKFPQTKTSIQSDAGQVSLPCVLEQSRGAASRTYGPKKSPPSPPSTYAPPPPLLSHRYHPFSYILLSRSPAPMFDPLHQHHRRLEHICEILKRLDSSSLSVESPFTLLSTRKIASPSRKRSMQCVRPPTSHSAASWCDETVKEANTRGWLLISEYQWMGIVGGGREPGAGKGELEVMGRTEGEGEGAEKAKPLHESSRYWGWGGRVGETREDR